VLKGGSKDSKPRAFQKTKYGGKLGEVSGSTEDLLLQML